MSFWRTKSLEDLKAEANSGNVKLERSLNAFSLIMLGIGAIIGAGLFSITGIAAANNAGPAILISFALAALGCALAGLCFSELAAIIPVAGGPYSYTYVALGELFAWIVGWALILEYAAGAAAVSISWSAYVTSLLKDLGINLPLNLTSSPWQGTPTDTGLFYGIINIPSLVVVGLLSYLLILGVDKSAKVNTALVIIKVLVVLLFIVLGFFYINWNNYTPFIPENTGKFGEFGWSGIVRAAGIVFFAYIGFDAVSTAAQEVKNPQKDLPIGIIGSLIVCTVLYILFSFVLVGLVPYYDLDYAAPIALAIDQTPFVWLNTLIKIAIIAGLTSVILVLMLGQSRIFFTMAKDGLLPPVFGKVHSTYHTPWIANLIVMGAVGLTSAFAPLSMVGSLTSMGTLLAFAIVCASVWVLRYKRPDIERPFKTPWVPFIPILGILVCVGLMLFLGIDNWIRLIVWLGIGLLVYFMYGRHTSHLSLHPNGKKH
ncbi:putative amino acid permease YhdG [Candidatus Rubidus massiliensis]|nr:putative amino acid permease YhdG [Candidatus Rubidus massiliensis]